MASDSLQSAITNLVTIMVNKLMTLVALHDSSANAHSDIRTEVNSKASNTHVHGNIKNDGSVGTAANKPLITTTNGLVQAGSFEGTASNIKMNGSANVGVRNTFARADHVHPTDTTRASTALATKTNHGLLSKEDKTIIDELPLTYATQDQVDGIIAGNVDLTGYIKRREIVDNITSTNATAPLSAKQGKELKTLIDGKANSTHYHKYIDVGMATSSDNISYTASITGVQYSHGILVAILNNKSGDIQAGATLNINGLGAKPIYYKNQTIKAGQFKYRSLSLFMYVTWNAFNGGNGAWIMLDDLDTDTNTTYTASTLKDPTAHNQAISTAANATQTAINTALDTKLASHGHGQITKDGKIGTASGKPIITTSNGVLSAGSFGSAAGTFCAGDDYRLSNARAPTAHTHSKSNITDFSHAHGSLTYEGKINADTSTVSKVAVTDGNTFLKTISKVPFANLNISKANITGLGIPGDAETATNIKMNGAVSAGSRSTYARGDHVHPTDTSRAPASHPHGKITTAGAVGTTANKPLITTKDGVIDAGSFEDTASNIQKDGTASSGVRNTFARGDHRHPTDDSRAPKDHATNATTYGASSNTLYGHSMASSTTPKMNGTATVGSETAKFARGDHIHPTDTTRAPNNHAVNAATYGLGTSDVYGHLKVSDSYTSSAGAASASVAASSKAVNDAYKAITSRNDANNAPSVKTLRNGWAGTVSTFVKNGWCIVFFENLKNANTHSSPIQICDSGYTNATGLNIYSFYDAMGAANFGVYVRVNGMGVIEGRCFTANHPVSGHIVFPIS